MTAPAPAGARDLTKSVGYQTCLRRRPSSGVGGLFRNFELGPLGHDLAVSKGVGSNMEDGAGATDHQSQGQATPEGSWLTVPS